jgi:hypothetical protein
MDERQQQRVAINESKFRAANENLKHALDDFRGGDADSYEIMCECALTECDDMFTLSKSEYEHVRSDPTWYAVLPEHVLPGAERAVEDHGRYWVIEKIDVGADVAKDLA